MAVKIKARKWQAVVSNDRINKTFGEYLTKKAAEKAEQKLLAKIAKLEATKLEDLKIHYEG